MCQKGDIESSATPGLCDNCGTLNLPFVSICKSCGMRIAVPLRPDVDSASGRIAKAAPNMKRYS